jgi:hypothetical protein
VCVCVSVCALYFVGLVALLLADLDVPHAELPTGVRGRGIWVQLDDALQGGPGVRATLTVALGVAVSLFRQAVAELRENALPVLTSHGASLRVRGVNAVLLACIVHARSVDLLRLGAVAGVALAIRVAI